MDECDDTVIKDERLELIFTCCHPALAVDGAGGAHAAGPRRAADRRDRPGVPGLRGDHEAAPVAGQGQDQGDRASRSRFPARTCSADRLDAVLAVIYLIYNEGYSGRVDLAAEAIRLGRVLVALMPDEPEAHGLLALMLIHHARRRARVRRRGSRAARRSGPLAVGPTHRSRRARAVLDRAIALGGRGAYVVQAAIASLQTEPSGSTGTQVAELYRRSGRPHRLAGGRAQPRGGGRRGRRPGRGARSSSTASTSTATATSTRPAASSCAGSAARRRPARRTAGRSSWPPTTPERRFLTRRLEQL